jgi:hypothetical protein
VTFDTALKYAPNTALPLIIVSTLSLSYSTKRHTAMAFATLRSSVSEVDCFAGSSLACVALSRPCAASRCASLASLGGITPVCHAQRDSRHSREATQAEASPQLITTHTHFKQQGPRRRSGAPAHARCPPGEKRELA